MDIWLYRGHCNDPHNEFFIRPNNDQLQKRDRNYWINGFAFQPINRPGAGPFINSNAEDDAITGLLNDVYLCGKTVHLLQLCQAKVTICLFTVSKMTCYFKGNFSKTGT